jgi:ribulose-phosphate 3-epimerase
MRRPLKISPSILPADFARLGDEVRAVEAAGADYIHVDVMDGRFVPNITFGPVILSAVRSATKLPIDAHLMIVEPDRYLEEFVRAGADLISVHAEAVPDVYRTLRHIRALGKKASIAINPDSPVDQAVELLPELDMVLLMTVNPGFAGQRFMDGVIPKIKALREEIDRRGMDVDIQVDGGIGPGTTPAVVAAGANVLVAGSAIFSAAGRDYKKAISGLRAAAGI